MGLLVKMDDAASVTGRGHGGPQPVAPQDAIALTGIPPSEMTQVPGCRVPGEGYGAESQSSGLTGDLTRLLWRDDRGLVTQASGRLGDREQHDLPTAD